MRRPGSLWSHQPVQEPCPGQSEGVPQRSHVCLCVRQSERDAGGCRRHTPPPADPSSTHAPQPLWLRAKPRHTCRRVPVNPRPAPPAPPQAAGRCWGPRVSRQPQPWERGGAPRPFPVPSRQRRSRSRRRAPGVGGSGAAGRSPQPLCAAPRAFALRLLPSPGGGGGERRAPRRGGRAGTAARLSLCARCHRRRKGGGERWDPGVRDPEEGAGERARDGKREGREVARARGGEERAGLTPGVQVPSHRAARRPALGAGTRTGRKGGNPPRLRALPASSPEASGPHGVRDALVGRPWAGRGRNGRS